MSTVEVPGYENFIGIDKPYCALAEIGGERLSEGLMHLVIEKALCFDALRLSE